MQPHSLLHIFSQALITWQKKSLFSRFTDSARSLLLISLPGTVASAATPPTNFPMLREDPSATNAPDQSVSSLQDTGILSTGGPSVTSLHPGGDPAPTKKRKGRRKLHILADIPDEGKSAELKALEAFIITNQQHMEDMDLSGGEDPTILHYIIATQPTVVGHREVMKFRRRPQFLEMLTRLVTLTLSKGHFDRVMEWTNEGFLWLSRRNEVLLNPRYIQRMTGEQLLAGSGKNGGGRKSNKTSNIFSNTASKQDIRRFIAQRPTQQTIRVPVVPEAGQAGTGSGKPVKEQADYAIMKKRGSISKAVLGRREAVASARQFSVRKSILPSLAAELSSQMRITKEDLEAKSVYVLLTKLPEMWRMHRCRSVVCPLSACHLFVCPSSVISTLCLPVLSVCLFVHVLPVCPCVVCLQVVCLSLSACCLFACFFPS